MSRRLGILGVLAVGAVFLVLLTGDSPESAAPTLAPTLSLASEDTTAATPPSSTAAVDETAAARVLAEQVVEDYWRHLSADASRVAAILDLPPADVTKEVGLAEYSAAFDGRYEAECTAGVIVQGEVVVDCLVEVLDDPLAAAFEIGRTPTQFRVRDGLITRVGYLKPYAAVDLALSAYAERNDPEGFAAACSNPDALYQSDAGVVYSGRCGVFLTRMVDTLVAFVQTSTACGEDCDAALLSAIRPSRD